MKKLLTLTTFLSFAAGAAQLKVASPNLADGQMIKSPHVYNSFGCSGENKSPALSWSKGPAGTQYYAVTVYDPDAPTGSGWWHWTLINIPVDTLSLPEGVSGNSALLPKGSLETRTDFGQPGYGGPCPPVGDKPHRYFFKVYALKDKINADKDATAAFIGFNINSLKLAEGALTAKYKR